MQKGNINHPTKKSRTISLRPPDDNQRPGRKANTLKTNSKILISAALYLTTDERRKFLIKEKVQNVMSLKTEPEIVKVCFKGRQSKKSVPKKACRISSLAISNSPLWKISDTATENKTDYYVKSLDNVIHNPFKLHSSLPATVLPGGFFLSDEEIKNINEVRADNKSLNEEISLPKNKNKHDSSDENLAKYYKIQSLKCESMNFVDQFLNSSHHEALVEKSSDTTLLPPCETNKHLKKRFHPKSTRQKKAKHAIVQNKHVVNNEPIDQLETNKGSGAKSRLKNKAKIRQKKAKPATVENKLVVNNQPNDQLEIDKGSGARARYLFKTDESLKSCLNESLESDYNCNLDVNSPYKYSQNKSLDTFQNELSIDVRSLTKKSNSLSRKMKDDCKKKVIKRIFFSKHDEKPFRYHKHLSRNYETQEFKSDLKNSSHSSESIHIGSNDSFSVNENKMSDESSSHILSDEKVESFETDNSYNDSKDLENLSTTLLDESFENSSSCNWKDDLDFSHNKKLKKLEKDKSVIIENEHIVSDISSEQLRINKGSAAKSTYLLRNNQSLHDDHNESSSDANFNISANSPFKYVQNKKLSTIQNESLKSVLNSSKKYNELSSSQNKSQFKLSTSYRKLFETEEFLTHSRNYGQNYISSHDIFNINKSKVNDESSDENCSDGKDKSLEINRDCDLSHDSDINFDKSYMLCQSLQFSSDESCTNHSVERLEFSHNFCYRAEDKIRKDHLCHFKEKPMKLAPSVGVWTEFHKMDNDHINLLSLDDAFCDYDTYEDKNISNDGSNDDKLVFEAIPSYFTNSEVSVACSTPKKKSKFEDTKKNSTFRWSPFQVSNKTCNSDIHVHSTKSECDNLEVETSHLMSGTLNPLQRFSNSYNSSSLNNDVPSYLSSSYLSFTNVPSYFT